MILHRGNGRQFYEFQPSHQQTFMYIMVMIKESLSCDKFKVFKEFNLDY